MYKTPSDTVFPTAQSAKPTTITSTAVATAILIRPAFRQNAIIVSSRPGPAAGETCDERVFRPGEATIDTPLEVNTGIQKIEYGA